MKILAFGASASKHSINKQLAHHVAGQIKGHDIELIDLLDYAAPIYTIDHEKEDGFPASVLQLLSKIKESDVIIISFAEHNGSYTAWFKNLFDWMSRLESKFLIEKQVLVLATSPGARGGLSVLQAAMERLPRHGAEIVGSFSLPNFKENFDPETGIVNTELKSQLDDLIKKVS
jgi:chromate reductase, NAD(P)H dehydrogenase (quinone)